MPGSIDTWDFLIGLGVYCVLGMGFLRTFWPRKGE